MLTILEKFCAGTEQRMTAENARQHDRFTCHRKIDKIKA